MPHGHADGASHMLCHLTSPYGTVDYTTIGPYDYSKSSLSARVTFLKTLVNAEFANAETPQEMQAFDNDAQL